MQLLIVHLFSEQCVCYGQQCWVSFNSSLMLMLHKPICCPVDWSGMPNAVNKYCIGPVGAVGDQSTWSRCLCQRWQ